MANDDKKDGDEMQTLQEIKTNEITQLLKMAITQDAEIKAAILSDSNAIAKILQSNIIDEIKQDLKTQKLIMRFDYDNEKQTFLNSYASEHTRNGYLYALKDFENYCNSHDIQTPIAATPAIIDNWIMDQRTNNKAPATIRRNCGALSAFFAKVERDTNHEIINPVRGTRARPKNTPTKKNKFYSMGTLDATRLQIIAKDVETIINNEQNNELKAIICCMAYRGLRCGSFEQMTVHGDQFRTISKGEETKGVLPAICIDAINAAGLKHNEPFKAWTSNRVKQAIKNHVLKLYNGGAITYKYSAHDFRHFFAINEYNENHDLYKLSKLLNHSGVAVTEKYLKGLNVIV